MVNPKTNIKTDFLKEKSGDTVEYWIHFEKFFWENIICTNTFCLVYLYILTVLSEHESDFFISKNSILCHNDDFLLIIFTVDFELVFAQRASQPTFTCYKSSM